MSLSNIRIVMVETTHPGNIGATARAMKTMGLANLVLVNPKIFPSAEATAMAAGADDILANAKEYAVLADAVSNCTLVAGTSARNRSIPWPIMTPRESATHIVSTSQSSDVALVFGRESSGLTNEELEYCNLVIQVPTRKDFSSLNIAAAIQIICYELLLAETGIAETIPADSDLEFATRNEMEKFFQHLEQSMIMTGFYNPQKPRKLMHRMKRLFNRAQPDQNEINMLRGLLAAIDKLNDKN